MKIPSPVLAELPTQAWLHTNTPAIDPGQCGAFNQHVLTLLCVLSFIAF
jgi:hypothetical protein